MIPSRSPLSRLPLWPYQTAIASVLLSLMLSSCSIPDGPGTGDGLPGAESSQPEIHSEITPETTPEIVLSGPGQLLPVTATAELKGQVFELEVARTRQEQALGLMFRSALPDNRGMLFPFDSPRRASFWMKDVPVPLDMVFLRNGRVIAIAASVPPCPSDPCPSYGPGRQLVDTVLELRSGRAAEIGLQAGDTVTIQPISGASQSGEL